MPNPELKRSHLEGAQLRATNVPNSTLKRSNLEDAQPRAKKGHN